MAEKPHAWDQRFRCGCDIGAEPIQRATWSCSRRKPGKRMPEDISDKPYVKYGTEAEPLIRRLFSLDYPEYKGALSREPHPAGVEHPFMRGFTRWRADRSGRAERYPGDQDHKHHERCPVGQNGITAYRITIISRCSTICW